MGYGKTPEGDEIKAVQEIIDRVQFEKYNENHDEAGRFASGSDSPGGKAATTKPDTKLESGGLRGKMYSENATTAYDHRVAQDYHASRRQTADGDGPTMHGAAEELHRLAAAGGLVSSDAANLMSRLIHEHESKK